MSPIIFGRQWNRWPIFSSYTHMASIIAFSMKNWVTARAQRRSRRLFYVKLRSTLLEKSPINAMRIGYLNALASGATFVHIVRDGIDVASSLERVATLTKKMAFRFPLNARSCKVGCRRR
jgi:hypothetical protein